MKKTFFMLLFFIMYSIGITAMHRAHSNFIHYDFFFALCKKGNLAAVKEFIRNNPKININYQYGQHKATPLLHAVFHNQIDIVWYLLELRTIKKMIQNEHKQTPFSQAICYWTDINALKKLFSFYSLDQVNILCQSIKLIRNWKHETGWCWLDSSMFTNYLTDILHNKRGVDDDVSLIHNVDDDVSLIHNKTILFDACWGKHLPAMIQLLEMGADITKKNQFNLTPYECFDNDFLENKTALFVAREAFNNGSCISSLPITLIDAALKNIGCSDVENYIKKLYIFAHAAEQCKSPKAHIWKPVCMQTCTILGLNRPNKHMDEEQCLATVMILPIKTLTEANLQLLFN